MDVTQMVADVSIRKTALLTQLNVSVAEHFVVNK